jgi:pimeloyl-ACP methyl ester carboxylesterase
MRSGMDPMMVSELTMTYETVRERKGRRYPPQDPIQKTERYRGRLSKLVRIREDKVPSHDKTPIYFHAVGKGYPPIVCCNGLGVSTFFWKSLERFFHARHQVVTWDYRGHGQSAEPKDPKKSTVNDLVQDLKTVLDACHIKKALLVGHSFGVQVILEFYRQYPERVLGMALCMGTYGRPMDTFYNSPASRYIFDMICRFALQFPKAGALIGRTLVDNPLSFYLGGMLKIMNTAMAPKEEIQKYIDHITHIDTTFFSYLCQNMQEHSAESSLSHISVPTLIIAGEEDTFTPLWLSKKMHRLIPDSEFFVIRRGSHAALVEQPELINLRIEKLLKERLLSSSPVSDASLSESEDIASAG